MPQFSVSSENQLSTCHPDLQRLAHAVIQIADFTVLEGHRGEEAQNRAYALGKSQRRWPHGEHNSLPSKAFDFAPYPIDWGPGGNTPAARLARQKAQERFVLFAGIFIAVAHQMGIKIRWGGDWDRDLDTRDENFRDYGHIEVVL